MGSRHYPDVAAVDARLAVIAKTRRVGAYLTAVTDTDPDTGKPTLTWTFDQNVIDADAATGGWYALLSNLPADEADATAILLHYKGQEAVERRYAAFKGPLAVAAIHLKNNRPRHRQPATDHRRAHTPTDPTLRTPRHRPTTVVLTISHPRNTGLAVVGVVYYLITLDLVSRAWSASIAVAIPAWLLVVKAPTTCGVATQNGGRCGRKVNGVIFGCGRSEHTWGKFFARFGWRRQPDPNGRASRQGTSVEVPEHAVMTVKIAEDWKSTVAFWLALTATCARS